MKAESIQDIKKNWPTLHNKLSNPTDFKEIYKYTFRFAKDPGARNLKFEMAIPLWEIILKDKFPYLKDWLEFLDKHPNKSDITKDSWEMLLEFNLQTKGDLSNFVDDGAWPSIIDEFVEHLKAKK